MNLRLLDFVQKSARKRAGAAMALAATLGLALAASAGADHGVLERVSVGEINGNGVSNPGFDGASADGTRVFFRTTEQLVSADTDNAVDVYERAGGVTTLVSAGQINGNGAFEATFRDASEDGVRVVFETGERLVNPDTDSSLDVYERSAGVTTLLSAGQINGDGDFDAGWRGSSVDGTRIIFATGEQLVSADTDNAIDLYQRAAGVTTLVSAGQTGGNGAFDAIIEGTSADGTRVVFRTGEQLVAADTDTSFDVYERSGGVTMLVSAGQINGNGDFDANSHRVSADGTRVFFRTSEPLVAADTDSFLDVYERSGGVTTRVSVGEINGNGAFHADFQGASVDGTRIFFATDERLVSADTDDVMDAYQRSAGVTTLVSAGQTGGNGAWPASFERASADGTRVFLSTREQLAAADTDSSLDIYERAGGVTTQVSAGQTGGNGAFSAFIRGASADGARVFFDTDEPLVSADTDGSRDLYERSAGVTTLASAGQTGGNGTFDAGFVGASADGRRVFFRTVEPLVSEDTDSSFDIYSASVPPPPAPGGGDAGNGGTGGIGDSGGSGTPLDTTDPVLGTLRLSSTRFRAARSGASSAASVGTRMRYSLSEAATTRFAVEKAAPGRKAWVRLKGSYTHRGQAGANTLRFRGRIGGRRLRPGGYRLVARATDTAANTSAAKRVRFRIVR